VISSITTAAGTARDASRGSLLDASNRCPPLFRSAGSAAFVPLDHRRLATGRWPGQQEIRDSRQSVHDVDLAIDQPA